MGKKNSHYLSKQVVIIYSPTDKIWWGASSSLGRDCGSFCVTWSGGFPTLNFAREVNSWNASSIFSMQLITSKSSEATATIGVISNTSTSFQRPEYLSFDLSSSAATFEFEICCSATYDELVIVLIADAASFRDFAHSELITLYIVPQFYFWALEASLLQQLKLYMSDLVVDKLLPQQKICKVMRSKSDSWEGKKLN